MKIYRLKKQPFRASRPKQKCAAPVWPAVASANNGGVYICVAAGTHCNCVVPLTGFENATIPEKR